MKSTKAMYIEGVGCVVQSSTQQGSNVAEALVFVPGVRVVEDVNSGRKLAPFSKDINDVTIAIDGKIDGVTVEQIEEVVAKVSEKYRK